MLKKQSDVIGNYQILRKPIWNEWGLPEHKYEIWGVCVEVKNMLLELIIWKSEIINHLRLSNAFCNTRLKVQSRTDSIAKVNIIVPGVLSFLTPVNNSHCANYNLNEAELDDDDHSAFSYVS